MIRVQKKRSNHFDKGLKRCRKWTKYISLSDTHANAYVVRVDFMIASLLGWYRQAFIASKQIGADALRNYKLSKDEISKQLCHFNFNTQSVRSKKRNEKTSEGSEFVIIWRCLLKTTDFQIPHEFEAWNPVFGQMFVENTYNTDLIWL